MNQQSIIWLLALTNVLLHLLFYDNLEYHRDELLYFSMGQHPSAGYATVPPLIGWLAAIIQNTIGFSLFAAKLVPAILSGAMILLVAGITRELGGKTYGILLAAVAFILTPIGLRAFFLYQPVPVDIFFWTLIWYLLLRYVNSGDNRLLWLLGLASGLALLNKFLIALLLGVLLLTLSFTRQRTIFKKKDFYAGIGLCILAILPNLIWQVTYDFPAFTHLADLNRIQLAHVDRAGFLLDQVLSPFAASLLVLPGVVFLLLDKEMKEYRFLGYAAIFVIGLLFLLRGKSYYTAGVFPLFIGAGAVFWEARLDRNWTKLLMVILLILITLPVLPMGLPVFQIDGMIRYFQRLEHYGIDTGRRFEDGTIHSLPQDYADMIGWEELTGIVNEAWQKVEKKDECFIYGENYGQAGAITIIGEKYGLPDAVSFHDSFRFWLPKEFDPDITTLIYINDELGEDVRELFAEIKWAGQIDNPHAREFGTKVYVCSQPLRSFDTLWRKALIRENIISQ